MKIFGERLREIRESKRESRKSLGEIIGVSVSQISDMESGRRGTTIERLALICRHYNVSADYMLGLSDRRETL